MVTFKLAILVAVGLVVLPSYVELLRTTYLPNLVDTIQVDKPGFATFVPNGDNSGIYHIAISSFNGAPFSSDYVYYVANYSLGGTHQIKRLNNAKIHWPNEISYTDQNIFRANKFGGLFVPAGFLVPSKQAGGLFFYPFTSSDRSEISDEPPIELSYNPNSNQDWFYHRARVVDLSGDGVNDILTCRTYKPIIGSTKVELVGFIFNGKTGNYTEYVILKDACDVFFDVADIDNDGRMDIIAAGFFIKRLVVLFSDDPANSYVNNHVRATDVDSNGGAFFDVKVQDLDLDSDGNKELLVTNHQGSKDAIKGSIYFYKLAGSLRKGVWQRFRIYDNFPVLKGGFNQAAPGSAKAFWPIIKEQNTTRPYLLVAGDGAEKAYVFQPSLTGPVNYTLVWEYLYKGFTVGGTSLADVNGDGIVEAIIAIYESNTCYVYSFVSK